MRHLIVLSTLLALSLSTRLDAGEGLGFKNVIQTDAVRFVSADSADGRVSTILFDNFDAATDTGRPSEPEIRIRQFTWVREFESTGDVCVEQDIRGFVDRSGSASASVIVHAGGKTTVVDLKKAIQAAKENEIDAECPVRKQAAEEADEKGFDEVEGEFDDFLVTISTRVPHGQKLQTTVLLLVDRVTSDDNDGSGAHLVIDSIDSEVSAAPAK